MTNKTTERFLRHKALSNDRAIKGLTEELSRRARIDELRRQQEKWR